MVPPAYNMHEMCCNAEFLFSLSIPLRRTTCKDLNLSAYSIDMAIVGSAPRLQRQSLFPSRYGRPASLGMVRW
jgi:hypothetical protein